MLASVTASAVLPAPASSARMYSAFMYTFVEFDSRGDYTKRADSPCLLVWTRVKRRQYDCAEFRLCGTLIWQMKVPAPMTLIPLSAFALFLAAIMTFTFACASDEELPTLEARAQEINKTVMCPVCPGESIDQSQHPRAKAMRGVVDEKLAEGSTNDEIRQFFVERYGPSVLLEPPREGLNWLVWIVPPAGLLAAAIALYFVLRLAVRSSPRSSGAPDVGSSLTEAERDDYYRRIEAALASDSDSERPSGAADTRDPGEVVAG